MFSGKVIAVIAVIAVMAAGAYFALPYLGVMKAGQSDTSSTSGGFFVSLTDPPNVPKGTSALYVTYSNIQLTVSQAGSVSTVDLPGTGTVNVLSLVNSSIVIGTTNLANGTEIKQIKFTISNATITIGGVNSSVVIGEGTLTTNLSGTFSGKEGALIDLLPSVTEIQTVDQNVFVLTPSVKSVIAPVGEFTQTPGGPAPQAGANLGFNNTYFGGFLNNPAAGISITNASLLVNGNSTTLKVTVTNHGNQSVDLQNLNLVGPKQVFFPPMNIQITPPPLPVGMITPLPPDRVVIFHNGTRIVFGSYPPNQAPYGFNFSQALATLSYNATGIYSLVPPGSTYAALFNPGGMTTMTMPPPPTLVPNGTIVLCVFPSGFVPPSSTPPMQQQQFMDQQPINRFIYPNGTLGFPPMSVDVPTVNMVGGNNVPVSSGLNVSVSMQQSNLPQGYVLAPGSSVTFTLSGEIALGPSPIVQSPNGQMTHAPPPFAVLTVGQSYMVSIFTAQGPTVPENVTAVA